MLENTKKTKVGVSARFWRELVTVFEEILSGRKEVLAQAFGLASVRLMRLGWKCAQGFGPVIGKKGSMEPWFLDLSLGQ